MNAADETTAQRTPGWILPLLLAALLVIVGGVVLAIAELAGRADILLAAQALPG